MSETSSNRREFDRRAARFSTQLRLRNADTDQFRHVNNAAIASCFEEARMAIFLRSDLEVCMKGKSVMVAHLAIDFLHELRFPGEIEIRTIGVATRNSSFELDQGLYARDILCSRARAVCVLIDDEVGRPTPLPAAFRQCLTPGALS